MSGSSVGPSTPQFHERLSLTAVLVVLAVRLVVLLVVGDEVVQREAVVGGDEVDAGPGPAALWLNVSAEAQSRGAMALTGAAPRQKSRTSSRNLSFHSAQPGGKPPT